MQGYFYVWSIIDTASFPNFKIYDALENKTHLFDLILLVFLPCALSIPIQPVQPHPHKQGRHAQDAQARPAGRAAGFRWNAGMGKNRRSGGVLGIVRQLNDVEHRAGNAQRLS